MTTLSIADTLKYANLQMAAEALYGFNATLSGAALVPGAVLQDHAITKEELMDGNLHTSKFAESEAVKFANDWTVVEHKSNTTTGFSGTLFKNKDTGELVMSIRSTEFIDDAARDNEATNALEIKETGWAFGQLSDLEAWYQHLRSDTSLGVGNQQIDVTGYSLGGYLAAEFNLLHQDEVAAGKIGKVVTFNGAGVGSINGLPTLQGAEGQNQIKSMLDYFVARRADTVDLSAGTLNLFKTANGKAAYADILAKQALVSDTASGLSMSLTLKGGFAGHAVAEGQEGYYDWLDDYMLLSNAISRASDIRSYSQYAKGLNAGTSTAPNTPAQIPDSQIAQGGVNYQLAVLATQSTYHTSARTFGEQASQLIMGRTVNTTLTYAIGINEPSILSNQYDVIGMEMDVPTATTMVSSAQWHYGQQQDIFIEDQPLSRGSVVLSSAWQSTINLGVRLLVPGYSNNDFGDTHSLSLLIDSLNVQNLLTRLAPATDAKVLNTILKQASNLEAKGTIFTQGKAEGDVLENVVNALGDLLGVRREEGSGWKEMTASPDGNTWYLTDDFSVGDKTYTGRNTFYKNFSLLTDALTTNPALTALLDKLTLEPSSVGTLKERAQRLEDFGAFAALYLGSPFVLKGQDAASQAQLETALTASLSNAVHDAWVADQALSAADRKAGKGSFSDQWYEDRSRYLADLNTRNVGNVADGSAVSDLKIAKGNKWLFEDAASKLNFEAAGALPNKTDPHSPPTYTLSQYINFGSAKAETLTGKSVESHLFGGEGNDTLIGGSASDWLEGGTGDDSITSGGGADTLLGGAGADRLIGGDAGDLLEGGDGLDTYLVEGGEIIDDTDHQGSIVFHGITLNGGFYKSDAIVTVPFPTGGKSSYWLSADGAVRYLWNKDETGNRALQISLVADPSRILTVQNFRSSGDYGITLPDAPIVGRVVVRGDKQVADITPDTPLELGDYRYDDNGNVQRTEVDAPDYMDVLQAPWLEGANVFGLGGNDALLGGIGNDLLDGGDGDDVLMADEGADTLQGGAGNDLLIGGGERTIQFTFDGDTYPASEKSADEIIVAAGRGWLRTHFSNNPEGARQ